MREDSEDHDGIRSRLYAMGAQPVDRAVAARVLARANRSGSWLRSTKAKVSVAAAGGFLVGSVGLASAGTLPDPAQHVAHAALGAVGIDVPPGHDRYNGPECGGTYKNHGQYVRSHKDDPNAPESPCGKPMRSVTKSTSVDNTDEHGPPPWAGNGKHKAKDDKAGEDHASTPGVTVPTTTTSVPSSTTSTTTTTPSSTTTTTEEPTTTTTAP